MSSSAPQHLVENIDGSTAENYEAGVSPYPSPDLLLYDAGLQQAQAEAYTNRYRNAWGIIAANQQQVHGPLMALLMAW